MDPNSKERTLHSMVTNFSPQELLLLDGISPGLGVQSLGMCADSNHSGRYRAAIESVLVYDIMTQLCALLEKENLLGGHIIFFGAFHMFRRKGYNWVEVLYLFITINRQEELWIAGGIVGNGV